MFAQVGNLSLGSNLVFFASSRCKKSVENRSQKRVKMVVVINKRNKDRTTANTTTSIKQHYYKTSSTTTSTTTTSNTAAGQKRLWKITQTTGQVLQLKFLFFYSCGIKGSGISKGLFY
jgi:hypothetical protein